MSYDKSFEKRKQENWSIQKFWNNTLTIPSKRDNQPRDILYASEIGSEFIEVYWSMLGIAPTNQISDIIRRKMEAGNYYENIVAWVFQRCGILKERQTSIRKQGLINVHGRSDIIAGCDGNWEEKKKKIESLFLELNKIKFDFPFIEQVKKLSFNLIENLSSLYPNGLEDKIYEVKSLNSMAFWRNNEPIGTAYPHHINQLTFYQKYNKLNIVRGSFLYIDRDTMSVSELPNIIKEEVVKQIEDWIEKMTNYYINQIVPPYPELIIFNEERNKYEYNWHVERSQYKDKILSGMNIKETDIVEKVELANEIIKQKKLADSAVRGEDKYGNKKYKEAVKLLSEGVNPEEVSKKCSIPIEIINHIINKK